MCRLGHVTIFLPLGKATKAPILRLVVGGCGQTAAISLSFSLSSFTFSGTILGRIYFAFDIYGRVGQPHSRERERDRAAGSKENRNSRVNF